MCISKIAFDMIFKKSNQVFSVDDKFSNKIMGPTFKKLFEESNKNMPFYRERISERIPVTTFDGHTLYGDFFLADTPSTNTIIAVHGYNSCGEYDCSNILPFFLKNGYNVLCTNNRGGKQSDCDDITFGVYERLDSVLWVDEINKKYPIGNIYLYGVSLGGATVCCMSEFDMRNVKGIISDCAYTSTRFEFLDISKRIAHFAPKLILNNVFKRFNSKFGLSIDEFSPINAVKNSKYPILFIHGTKDFFIDPICAQQLYAACTSKKEIFLVDGAGHAASYVTAKDTYETKVLNFFTSL